MSDTVMLHRCCMCPQKESESRVCADGSPCRFVRRYADDRGWRYRVMPGLGDNAYKARYNKPGYYPWKGIADMMWRTTFDEAQQDLNTRAKEKGWHDLGGMTFPP